MLEEFTEFALLESFVALVGFLMTLKHFKGAMRYLGIVFLSDAISNMLYVFYLNSSVFTINTFVICAMVLLGCHHIRKQRRML